MTESGNKEPDGGVFGRLAGRGEDALTRFMDELGRNPRVTDALGRAMSAKGRVDETTRRTLSQMGLAAADELKELRKQIERLEKRLEKLETSGAGGGATGSSGRKPATSTKASGGTAKRSSSGTSTRSGSASRSKGSGGSGSGGSGSSG